MAAGRAPREGDVMVVLEELSYSNWREASRLEVFPTQVGFFPNIIDSILEAQFFSESEQFLIRAESAEAPPHAVGYALYGREKDTGRRKIFRMMIDRRHQGRGYA